MKSDQRKLVFTPIAAAAVVVTFSLAAFFVFEAVIGFIYPFWMGLVPAALEIGCFFACVDCIRNRYISADSKLIFGILGASILAVTIFGGWEILILTSKLASDHL